MWCLRGQVLELQAENATQAAGAALARAQLAVLEPALERRREVRPSAIAHRPAQRTDLRTPAYSEKQNQLSREGFSPCLGCFRALLVTSR